MKYFLSKSTSPHKKWMVKYLNTQTNNINTIHFGQAGASDFTLHKDETRRDLYHYRHIGDNVTDLTKSGCWSWWLLWNEPTLESSIRDMEQTFKITIINRM